MLNDVDFLSNKTVKILQLGRILLQYESGRSFSAEIAAVYI